MSKPTMAEFRLVIEKNGIDPAQLSKPIKGYIRDYNDVESGIDELEILREQNGGLNEDDQRELDEFIEALAEKDKDLVKRINSYIANAEQNKERGQRLAEGKAKAKQKKEEEAANIAKGLNADGSAKTGTPPGPAAPGTKPTPPPVPPVNTIPNGPPVKKAETDMPYTEAEEVPEEKKGGFWGWLAAAVIVGIGIAVGVKLKGKN
jgi:hypothetical protein